MKSVSELLSVYSKVYVHYFNDNDDNDDVYELEDRLKMLAKFANMIATDPFSDLTQKKALFFEEHMDSYHSEVIKNISDKDYEHKIYPCKCLKQYIKDRVKELEKKLYENEEEENDDVYIEYERWLIYYEKFE